MVISYIYDGVFFMKKNRLNGFNVGFLLILLFFISLGSVSANVVTVDNSMDSVFCNKY